MDQISFATNLTPNNYAEIQNESIQLPDEVDDADGDTAIPETYSQRFPAANPDGKAKTMARRRNRKPDGHVGRPPNSFMLFRADFVNKGRLPASMSNLNTQAQLGKIIAQVWHGLPEEERRVWKRRAAIEKAKHAVAHPDYQYRPTHAKKKRDSDSAEVEEIPDKPPKARKTKASSKKPTNVKADNVPGAQVLSFQDDRDEYGSTPERDSPGPRGGQRPHVPCPRVIPVPHIDGPNRRPGVARVISMPQNRHPNDPSSSYYDQAHDQAVRASMARPQYRSRLNDHIMQLVGRGLSAEEIESEAAAWERREAASGNGADAATAYSDSPSESEYDTEDDEDTADRSVSRYRLVPVSTHSSFQPRESFARGEPVAPRGDSEPRRRTTDSPQPMDQDEPWSPAPPPSPPPSAPSPIGRRESAPTVLHRLDPAPQARLSATWYDGTGHLSLPPPSMPTRRIVQPSNLPPPVFRPVFGAASTSTSPGPKPMSVSPPPMVQRLRQEVPPHVQAQRSRSMPFLPAPLKAGEAPPPAEPEVSVRLPSFSEGFSSFCV
ncbi:uncharacterized protein SCHCODRAFT_02512642 [Schizophyllum commune H4-8]|uniref:HMG box domain-containing protein n=1 Tax=Schizophyllum commune (strain H4-8 / FGSC 9210) TaxID=578458 RepID=D8QE15_SCHCM|nr:uncharacterized protein SCHCODRAFT_02512642 [Schizophyllum commune H4-8]KAI5888488.1 hypothetical protein SCHCODRAFT_02512642 [Schizophyllum commune H4-8]